MTSEWRVYIYHILFYFIGMQLSQKRDRIWREGSVTLKAHESLCVTAPLATSSGFSFLSLADVYLKETVD